MSDPPGRSDFGPIGLGREAAFPIGAKIAILPYLVVSVMFTDGTFCDCRPE
jgi:hypothetical protein